MKNITAEQFVDDKRLRDTYVDNIEVLSKVKFVSLLPDKTFMTSGMVADYYEVRKGTIDVLFKRHKDEFVADGIKSLSNEDLRRYKSTHLQHVSELNRVPRLTLFTRRALLRIGILLRDSHVAKEVRSYLLNVEQSASKDHRAKATGRYWTGREEIILYDTIHDQVMNKGKTLTEACKIVSAKINRSLEACRNHYTQVIKELSGNEELVRRIENNKYGGLKLVSPPSPSFEDNVELKEFIRSIIHEATFSLTKEIRKLDSELKKLKTNVSITVDKNSAVHIS